MLFEEFALRVDTNGNYEVLDFFLEGSVCGFISGVV